MGIKQRRERERQEIRQRILSAAREIAAEEGWQAVTTRKVDECIEYSQSTIYEYFDAFLKRHGGDFAQFGQNSSRIDPHTYDVVYLDEPARS